MPIIVIFIVLICVAVALYCANRFLPMDANIRYILNIAICIAVVIWLLKVFGVIAYLSKVTI